MKCFRLRCCVNNSFLVIHQGNQTLENNKTLALRARVSYRFLACLDPLMKHSNSLFTYNIIIEFIKHCESYRIFYKQTSVCAHDSGRFKTFILFSYFKNRKYNLSFVKYDIVQGDRVSKFKGGDSQQPNTPEGQGLMRWQ